MPSNDQISDMLARVLAGQSAKPPMRPLTAKRADPTRRARFGLSLPLLTDPKRRLACPPQPLDEPRRPVGTPPGPRIRSRNRYEKQGHMFPRFGNMDASERFARERSRAGGAGLSPLARKR